MDDARHAPRLFWGLLSRRSLDRIDPTPTHPRTPTHNQQHPPTNRLHARTLLALQGWQVPPRVRRGRGGPLEQSEPDDCLRSRCPGGGMGGGGVHAWGRRWVHARGRGREAGVEVAAGGRRGHARRRHPRGRVEGAVGALPVAAAGVGRRRRGRAPEARGRRRRRGVVLLVLRRRLVAAHRRRRRRLVSRARRGVGRSVMCGVCVWEHGARSVSQSVITLNVNSSFER